MATETNPAIDLLVSQIEELERKANAYKASVNVLCASCGLPPRFPDLGGGGNGGAPIGGSREPLGPPAPASTHIRPDAFYGRPQQTAVRELLGIRKASGDGPAKPLEILDGLRAGGYQVEAKNDEIALVGLRAMLRKRTEVFHKLPNGTWGLREWYPNAKPQKEAPKEAPEKNAQNKAPETEGSPPDSVSEAASAA